MTEKKIDKKVNEAQEALKDQELDKVTGGQDDYPAKQPKENDPKKNTRFAREWNEL